MWVLPHLPHLPPLPPSQLRETVTVQKCRSVTEFDGLVCRFPSGSSKISHLNFGMIWGYNLPLQTHVGLTRSAQSSKSPLLTQQILPGL